LKTILSVDDDLKVRQALEFALRKKGYDITVTNDPLAVAALVAEKPVDLVMLDIRMPIKNGFEVFRELKKRIPALKVLFVTAYPSSFSVSSEGMLKMWQHDFADGETDILYKPFTVDVLYEKVAGLIGPPK